MDSTIAIAPTVSPAKGPTVPLPSGAWELSVYADEIYAPEAGLETGLELLQRRGIHYTTLRTIGGDSFLRLSDAELDGLARTLGKYAMKVSALEAPLFKCPLRENNALTWPDCRGFSDDMTFEDHLWFMARAFQIADRFDTGEVRCFAFWKERNLDEAFPEIVDKLGIAAARAEAAGHPLHLQNQPDTYAGSGRDLARIIDAVGSKYLTACYDVGNAGRVGAEPFPGDYHALRGRLSSVQVAFQAVDIRCGWGLPDPDTSGPKDSYIPFYFWQQSPLPISGWVQIGDQRFDLAGPRTFLPPERTVGVDYRSLLRALRQDGYAGPIGVDTSYFLTGAGADTHREIEANFDLTISGLRRLIAELGS